MYSKNPVSVGVAVIGLTSLAEKGIDTVIEPLLEVFHDKSKAEIQLLASNGLAYFIRTHSLVLETFKELLPTLVWKARLAVANYILKVEPYHTPAIDSLVELFCELNKKDLNYAQQYLYSKDFSFVTIQTKG